MTDEELANIELATLVRQLLAEVKRLRADNLAHCSALQTTAIWMELQEVNEDLVAEVKQLKVELDVRSNSMASAWQAAADAVVAEREACARTLEACVTANPFDASWERALRLIATAIRARKP